MLFNNCYCAINSGVTKAYNTLQIQEKISCVYLQDKYTANINFNKSYQFNNIFELNELFCKFFNRKLEQMVVVIGENSPITEQDLRSWAWNKTRTCQKLQRQQNVYSLSCMNSNYIDKPYLALNTMSNESKIIKALHKHKSCIVQLPNTRIDQYCENTYWYLQQIYLETNNAFKIQLEINNIYASYLLCIL